MIFRRRWSSLKRLRGSSRSRTPGVRMRVIESAEMAVRIQTRNAMDLAKQRLCFCYLCGQSLAEQDTRTEHVLARGLLDADSVSSSSWPITLRVHAQCDQEHKQPFDSVLIAVQRVHSQSLQSVPKSDRAIVRKRIRESETAGVPASLSAYEASACFRSIWASVRGFHASLYQSFLPNDTKRLVFAPAPSFNHREATPIDQQLDRDRWMAERIALANSAATLEGSWDGITAWDERVKYRCVWHPLPESRSSKWLCLWTLSTPQVLSWSRSVTGLETPWRGVYRTSDVPASAAQLTDAAIEKLSADLERRAGLSNVRSILNRAGRAE